MKSNIQLKYSNYADISSWCYCSVNNSGVEIFSKCGKENCFGRTIVEEITGLKPSGASKLIKLLVDSEVIVPVTGHGKGKYRFQ